MTEWASIALDVVGFSQFKKSYQADMEECAQQNTSKMTKGEFLEAISSQYQYAFTPKNIKKAFETTGTWPIDQSKITTEAMASSEVLSGKSRPIVSLYSPVKKLVQAFDTHMHRNAPSGPPLPSPLDFNLLPSIPPSPSIESLDSIIESLGETHAALMFQLTQSQVRNLT